MATIVKIQRIDRWRQLIHNESHTIVQEGPLDPAINKLMGPQNTVYAKAKVHKGKGKITILGLVRPQAW